MHISLSDDLSDDELEEEPAHPIGFKSPLGRTWFSLDPPTQSQVNSAFGRTTYAWLDDSDSEDDGAKENNVHVQSYPPLSSYIRSDTVPTAALLSADRRVRNGRKSMRSVLLLTDGEEEDELNYSDDEEEDNKRRSEAPLSASVPPPIPAAIKEALSSPTPSQVMRAEQFIQQKIQADRQRVDEECRRNTEILRKLVLKGEKEAAAKLKHHQDEEEKIRQAQEARDEQYRQVQATQDAQAAKVQKEKDEQDRKRQEERDAAAHRRQMADQEAKKKTEFVDKAKERVQYVTQVRNSIEPFEQNKAVGKRRLGMKKIARGKLNTLSENADKIQQVAAEVSQAITQARQDDAAAKHALEQNQPGVTPDMKTGKRYLLDLIASNAMTRVQAETFSGVKGDGFPLAAMISMISAENKDFGPILEGHIYMVCPTAVPTLPAPENNASEDDLMAGLGMQKKKNGEFESFPEFLARTESVISFMADIQSSLPSSNALMGGNAGALKWLVRFLDLLPPPPTSPLPLITAPVLSAFLSNAGHMLANVHADAFKKILDTISTDVVSRLDEGEIGKPSSIRLNKVISGGFEHFRRNLPAKAIPELYCGASRESKRHVEGSVFGGTIGQDDEQQGTVGGFQNSRSFAGQAQQNTPFSRGGPSSSTPARNPFGAPSGASRSSTANSFGSTSVANNPFGSPTSASPGFGNSNNAPFSTSNQSTASTPFGSTTSNVSQPNAPFGSPPSASTGFGASTANPSPFGTGTNPTSSPFVGATAPSSFGGSSVAATSPSPFGSNQGPTTDQSPFGGGAAPTQPFGGGNTPSTFGVKNTPFGSSTNTTPSPFGGNAPASSSFPAQPFGSSSNASPSPFGVGQVAPSQSPFVTGPGAPSSSPFGTGQIAPSASPFGGGQGTPDPSPFQTPFGGSNSTPFGSSGGSQTPLGTSGGMHSSPFGGGMNAPTPSPFSNQNASPFGTSAATQPFGSTSNSNSSFGNSGSSGFGGSSQQSQRNGGGGSKNNQPCKFFSKGQCRFGADCRFSHDIGSGGNNSGFGGSTGGFGGSNSGGFGGGGFGANTPFGGPRR